jgi:hypothetical protein
MILQFQLFKHLLLFPLMIKSFVYNITIKILAPLILRYIFVSNGLLFNPFSNNCSLIFIYLLSCACLNPYNGFSSEYTKIGFYLFARKFGASLCTLSLQTIHLLKNTFCINFMNFPIESTCYG